MHLLKVSVEVTGTRVCVHMAHELAMKFLMVLGAKYNAVAVIKAKLRLMPHAVQVVTGRNLGCATDDTLFVAPPDAPAPRALDMLQQLAAIDPLFERQVMAKHAIVGARVIVAQFLGSLFVVATAGKYAAIYLTVSHRLSPNGGFISAFTDGSEDSSIAAFSSIHSACEAGDRKPADLLADVLAVGSLALSARLAKSVVFSCYRVVAGHTFLAALRAHSSHHHIGARRERGHGYPDDLSVAGAPAQDGRVVVNRFARRNDLDAFFFDQDVAHKGLPWLTRRLRFCDYYSTPVLIVG